MQIRLLAALERPLQRQLRAELQRVGRAAAQAIADGHNNPVAHALEGHSRRVEAILRAHYLAAARRFGLRILDELGKRGGLPAETKDTQGQFLTLVEAWITRRAAERVTDIADTTRGQIVEILRAGVAAGDSLPAMSKRMVEETGRLSRVRAARIARTESHTAANAASVQAVESTGLELSKEWIAAGGERTRADHAAANGQVRARNDAFDVGGAKLMYPGDPDGPAAQIINCRCAIGWLTQRPSERRT